MARVDKQRKINGTNGKMHGGITGRGFVPGKSGNPSGRAKGSINIWSRIQRELKKRIEEGPLEGKRHADAVAKAFVTEAIAGKWPLKELIDRELGKVPDRIANPDGSPVTFTLKIGDRTLGDES
jgi:hypothetical protein